MTLITTFQFNTFPTPACSINSLAFIHKANLLAVVNDFVCRNYNRLMVCSQFSRGNTKNSFIQIS